MVVNLDDNIGRLTVAIRALRLDTDTLLVLISGHGRLFGAHGRRAKNIFYDEAVRVPFLVRWLVIFAQGEEQDVCLNTVDVMPTLLGRMGLKILSDVEGANLSLYPRDKNKTTQDAA
jgi:arylsulfatase A-like enzyme